MLDSIWTNQRSILLSRVIVYFFAITLLAMDLGGVWLADQFGHLISVQRMTENGGLYFMICLYGCSLPAYVVLYGLHKLLVNIRDEKVFVQENVSILRRISWCMFIAMAICMAFCWPLPILSVVVLSAGFIGLIVRVVKNVFERAIQMKQELDLTI